MKANIRTSMKAGMRANMKAGMKANIKGGMKANIKGEMKTCIITRMKTSINLHLIIYIVAATLLTACENEIPYNAGQRDPMLIMNALLDAGRTENFVYLHLNEGNKTCRLNEATLTLYVNGNPMESPQAISPDEYYQSQKDQLDEKQYEALLKSMRFKLFRLNTVLKPGDDIRLEATAEGGKYHVRSHVTVPQPIHSLQVDTCTALLRQWGSMKTYRQYRITMQDIPNEKNYYRLEIVNSKEFQCSLLTNCRDENGNFIVDENDRYVYTTTYDTVRYTYTNLINREDVILTDGHVTNSDDDENAMFPNIENKYNIFNDNRFSNSSATLKVYTPLYDDNYDILLSLNYTSCLLKHTITVRLLSLPESYYRYLKALNCMDDDDYDEALMEPVSLPSNVEGGLGFVGVSSAAQYIIEMPDKQWKW